MRSLWRSPEQRRLIRIYPQLMRHKRDLIGEVAIRSNLKLKYIDGPSFVSAYDEIFVNGIYKLPCGVASPYVIDAGANVGLASVYWTLQYPEVRGIAFEPDPTIFSILKENLQRCNSRILPVMAALGTSEGTCHFESQGADSGRILTAEVETTGLHPRLEVRQTRLSTYLVEPVDLLKIDIEGAELMVLREVRQALADVKRIFVESHAFKDERDVLPDVLALLRDAGFKLNMDVIASAFKGFECVAPNKQIETNINIYGHRC